MATKNTCQTLQRYVLTANPSTHPQQKQPIIALRNADVVISLHHSGSHDLHLRSDMLMRASHFFQGALREQFVARKTTGTIDPGNGDRRTMKRFELEFFANGEHLLVGKDQAKDQMTRHIAYFDNFESEAYQSQVSKRGIRQVRGGYIVPGQSEPTSNPDLFGDVDPSEPRIIIAVNVVGFSMLCGFPTKGLIEDRILPRDRDRRTRFKGYIIQRLLQWIDFYDVLESVRWQLIDWIMNFASSGAFRDTDFNSTPIYLRIATALRDRDFFEWVLNKDPFFNREAKYHLSKIDRDLGLGAWAPVFDKHIIHATDLQLNLQYIDRYDWIESDNEELIASARCYWQLMVARSYFTYSASVKGLWPLLGVLDTFFNDIPADSGLTGQELWWDRTDGYRDICLDVEHSVAYPLLDLSEENRAVVVKQIDRWVNMAQESILGFLTPAPEEPYRLRLVLGEFWKHYGFPWDYRDKDKSEGVLFSSIANQSLTEFQDGPVPIPEMC